MITLALKFKFFILEIFKSLIQSSIYTVSLLKCQQVFLIIQIKSKRERDYAYYVKYIFPLYILVCPSNNTLIASSHWPIKFKTQKLQIRFKMALLSNLCVCVCVFLFLLFYMYKKEKDAYCLNMLVNIMRHKLFSLELFPKLTNII